MELVLPWKMDMKETVCLVVKCVSILALNTGLIMCFLKDVGTLFKLCSSHFSVSNQCASSNIFGKD